MDEAVRALHDASDPPERSTSRDVFESPTRAETSEVRSRRSTAVAAAALEAGRFDGHKATDAARAAALAAMWNEWRPSIDEVAAPLLTACALDAGDALEDDDDENEKPEAPPCAQCAALAEFDEKCDEYPACSPSGDDAKLEKEALAFPTVADRVSLLTWGGRHARALRRVAAVLEAAGSSDETAAVSAEGLLRPLAAVARRAVFGALPECDRGRRRRIAADALAACVAAGDCVLADFREDDAWDDGAHTTGVDARRPSGVVFKRTTPRPRGSRYGLPRRQHVDDAAAGGRGVDARATAPTRRGTAPTRNRWKTVSGRRRCTSSRAKLCRRGPGAYLSPRRPRRAGATTRPGTRRSRRTHRRRR